MGYGAGDGKRRHSALPRYIAKPARVMEGNEASVASLTKEEGEAGR